MIRILCLNPTIDRMYYIEGFNAGNQYHGNCPDTYPGGKGINIARVLSNYQVKAIVYAFVGGATGKKIEEEISRIGQKGVYFWHEGETRSTINVMDRKNNRETEITESGAKITKEQQEEFLRRLESDIEEGDLVICSGLPANGMDYDIYKQVSNICYKKDAKCFVDANREYLANSFPGRYSFAKPNENELKSLFSVEKDMTEKEILICGQKLLQLGVEVVLVSMGSEGAIAITKNACFKVDIPKVNVVSTIGSGDSSVAGFCVGIIEGKGIQECLKLSMAFGVVNAMHAEVGYVTPVEVEGIIKKIDIQVLGSEL